MSEDLIIAIEGLDKSDIRDTCKPSEKASLKFSHYECSKYIQIEFENNEIIISKETLLAVMELFKKHN